VPPTPVESSPRTARLLNSLALNQPLKEEAVEYDSPDEDEDEDEGEAAGAGASSNAGLPAPPKLSTQNGPVRADLVPRMPHAPTRASTNDSSSTGASGHPASVPSGSPHLFAAEVGRRGSPSPFPSPSSATSDYRTRPRELHRRQSSTHRVRETIYGQQSSSLNGERLVNQYRLGRQIGQGAYATVTLAIDVGTGEQYVSGYLFLPNLGGCLSWLIRLNAPLTTL
jgi:[calcium/calmodulin-dependent protein kinase] kinase